MDVQPASISQVIESNGRYVEISADVGSVVADLKRVDPSLGVRFDEGQGCFHVYCAPTERDTYLVLTVKAYRNGFGTWEGLDQRVVREIERVGADDYDFAGEVERMNRDAERAKKVRREEKLGEAAQDAYKLLRDGSGRNTRTASIPKDVAA